MVGRRVVAAAVDGSGDGRGLSLAKPALRVARVGT